MWNGLLKQLPRWGKNNKLRGAERGYWDERTGCCQQWREEMLEAARAQAEAKPKVVLKRLGATPRPRTLADLAPGQSAQIVSVECAPPQRGEQLMADGLVRGQTITLVQRDPTYVIRVHETELVLDDDAALCIEIK